MVVRRIGLKKGRKEETGGRRWIGSWMDGWIETPREGTEQREGNAEHECGKWSA